MFKRKRLLVLVMLVGLPTAFFLWRFYWLRWTAEKLILSKQTTYITEPLDEAGYPDYYAALNERMSQGVTPENNAAVLLLQIFGPATLRLVEDSDEYCRLLVIKPLPETGDYYVDWVNWQQRTTDSNPLGSGLSTDNVLTQALLESYDRPWRRDEFPEVAQWIDSQEKHLDAIVTASKRPRFYAPLVRRGELPLLSEAGSDLQPAVGDATEGLRRRAMMRTGEGEFQKAWQDLTTCNRLGTLYAQSPLLLDAQMGVTYDAEAYVVESIFIGVASLDADEWAEIRREYDALPKPPRMADKLELGARFACLDLICATARHGVPQIDRALYGDPKVRANPGPFANAPLGVDWNVPLRMANEWMNRYVSAAAIADPFDRSTAITALDWEAQALAGSATELGFFSEVFSRATASDHMGQILAGAFYSGLSNFGLLEERNRAYRPLIRAGLALAHYKAERGSYPDQLDDLVPDCFDSIPLDPYAEEKPFRYRKTDEGYRLYSVGINGKDDGGKTYNNDDQSDDLLIEVPWKPKAKPMASATEANEAKVNGIKGLTKYCTCAFDSARR